VQDLKVEQKRRDGVVDGLHEDKREYLSTSIDLAKKLDEANHKLELQRVKHEKEILELKIQHAEEIKKNQLDLSIGDAHCFGKTQIKTKPAEEQNIFIDPKDSPSRSPAKKKKKKKGGWGGDRKSAAAKKQQADKKQQQRA
jgi:hypothetical protein